MENVYQKIKTGRNIVLEPTNFTGLINDFSAPGKFFLPGMAKNLSQNYRRVLNNTIDNI
jgi:hypothetical protein